MTVVICLISWAEPNKSCTGEKKWRRQKVCFFDPNPCSLRDIGAAKKPWQVQTVQARCHVHHPPFDHCPSSPGLGAQWMSPGSVFGWAHWEKMCCSSTSSFMSTPGRRLGQHTPMLSYKLTRCCKSVAKTRKQLCLRRGAEKWGSRAITTVQPIILLFCTFFH